MNRNLVTEFRKSYKYIKTSEKFQTHYISENNLAIDYLRIP